MSHIEITHANKRISRIKVGDIPHNTYFYASLEEQKNGIDLQVPKSRRLWLKVRHYIIDLMSGGICSNPTNVLEIEFLDYQPVDIQITTTPRLYEHLGSFMEQREEEIINKQNVAKIIGKYLLKYKKYIGKYNLKVLIKRSYQEDNGSWVFHLQPDSIIAKRAKYYEVLCEIENEIKNTDKLDVLFVPCPPK